MIWIRRILLPLLAVAAAYLILTYVATVPWFFLALALAAILLAATLTAPSTLSRALCWNLACIVLLLGLAEAWFAGLDNLGLRHNQKISYAYNMIKSGPPAFNDITGYSGSRDAKGEEKKMFGDELVFDATYTMTPNGLRVSPHDLAPPRNSSYQNVVFFGCSFTYGTGVNDADTLPYLVEEDSGGRYRTYNFAFGGYGPHQMLRILESGLLDKVITDKKPAIAVYAALVEHIDRASGKYPYFLWDINGPKYTVDAGGNLVYGGKFDGTPDARIKYRIFKELGKSYLIRENEIFRRALGWTRTEADRDLFIKIIVKSRDVFAEKYQGDFYVLFRGYKNDQDSAYVIKALRRHQIKVVTTDEILDPYHEPPEKYTIAHDGHPNKLYNQRIAAYLVNNLEKQERPGDLPTAAAVK